MALGAAGVPMSDAQLSRWWPSLGALPGTSVGVVEHAQALLPLLGRGTAGRYSTTDRAAIGLARAGYPCPVLREVVGRLSGVAEWAKDEQPGSHELSEWETGYGVLVPDKATEQTAASAFGVVGGPWDDLFEAAAMTGWFSMVETLVHAFKGGDVPAGEIGDLGRFAGGARPATFLTRWLQATGRNGAGRVIASFVRRARPWYLVALVRMASEAVEDPRALDAVCALTAVMLYSQVGGIVLLALDAAKSPAEARSTAHELLGQFLDLDSVERPELPPPRRRRPAI